MSTRDHTPDTVEIFDPIDLWIHIGAMVGVVGLFFTGPLLQSPPLGRALDINPGTLALVHAMSALLALGAWLFHLARVILSWLEGENPWGLAPRLSDLKELARGVTWSLRLADTPPVRGRFNYRERLPYLLFMLLAPLMAFTGLAQAQPDRFYGLLGAQGLITAASLHGAVGLGLALVLAWHIYFALLQPGMFRPRFPWLNAAWFNGKGRWEVQRLARPDWCDAILAELHMGLEETVAEEENASVQQLLEMGNQAAREKRYPEACKLYKEALVLYPGYPQALFNLGATLAKMDHHSLARTVLTQYLKQDQFGTGATRARALLKQIGRDQSSRPAQTKFDEPVPGQGSDHE